MASLLTWSAWLVGAVVAMGIGVIVAANAGGLYGAAILSLLCGGACFAGAWMRERRARGEVRLRHCLECGASVLDDAAVCPRCQSVRLEGQVGKGSTPGAFGGGRSEGREMPVSAYSSDASGVIGWVDAAPPSGYGAAEGVTPRSLRRWGIALVATSAVLAVVGAITPA